MTLVRFKKDSDLVSDTFGSLFNTPFLNFGKDVLDTTSYSPRTRITEDKDNFYIHMEMPGTPKEDVKINVENNLLSVRGEKKQQTKTEDTNLIMNEIVYGEFTRSFNISKEIKLDAIEAEFKDGILNITLPKIEEAKPVVKEIQVK
ncbi:MAG: Hsp20/alpha crystallin family protein [Ignavibacteriae bacterium]|jgi:HSP20 family protein|nr:Hsp20/alpha crystallin family protein [Ignavibacteriota bacterium]